MANRQQPPSFKTDVHRAKTKKWVEAKAYNYGGDDWGGYDDYDDYDDYEDTPPLPQPAGPRQRGQVSSPVAQPMRSNVSAQYPAPINTSFVSDERRNFSAGAGPPPSMQTRSATGPYTASGDHPTRGAGPEAYSAHPTTTTSPIRGGVGQIQSPAASSNYSQIPSAGAQSALSSDYAEKSDFSPSAMPPPLSARSPPISPASGDSQGHKFPPRKSSLSQMRPAHLVERGKAEQQQTDISGSGNDAESTGQSETETDDDTEARPVFVRPADIYRRVEAEKEKERQSMDSNRPSIDSLNRPPQERSKEEASANARLRPQLQPLVERKSEYGLEGFSVPDPTLAKALGAKVTPAPSSTIGTQPDSQLSQAPSLPQLSRVSGFGTGFWDLDSNLESSSTQSRPQRELNTGGGAPPSQTQGFGVQTNTDLQHQPSVGFRSAVETAFDANDARSDTLSPTSTTGGQDSGTLDVSRSNTNSTAGISPIMSRVRPELGTTQSTILEETPDTTLDPQSSRTVKGPTLLSETRRQSDQSDASRTPRSIDFKPGFRREQNSPSPSANAHRRQLSIEADPNIPQGSQAEISTDNPPQMHEATLVDPPTGFETPTLPVQDPMQASSYATRESDLADSTRDNPGTPVLRGIARAEKEAQSAFLRDRPANPISPMTEDALTPDVSIPRSQTPVKGRVKDLASKYNEFEETRRGSVTSSSGSVSSRAQQQTPMEEIDETTAVAKQGVLGVPQERPKMPGGWTSYATSLASSSKSERPTERSPRQSVDTPKATNPSSLAQRDLDQSSDDTTVDFTPTNRGRPVNSSEFDSQPMAGLKAAGTAIGESLKAAVGLGGNDAPESAHGGPPPSATIGEQLTHGVEQRGLGVRQFQAYDAGETPMTEASEAGPTPPPKDTNVYQADRHNGYFASGGGSGKARASSVSPPNERHSQSPSPKMSMDSSPGDMESDRLRKDIVRSLNVPGGASGKSSLKSTSDGPVLKDAHSQDSLRASTLLPREYDSYWASTANNASPKIPSDSPVIGAESPAVDRHDQTFNSAQGAPAHEQKSVQRDALGTQPVPKPPAQKKTPKLMRRFSWEASDGEGEEEEADAPPNPSAQPLPAIAIPGQYMTESTEREATPTPAHKNAPASPESESFRPEPSAQTTGQSQPAGGISLDFSGFEERDIKLDLSKPVVAEDAALPDVAGADRGIGERPATRDSTSLDSAGPPFDVGSSVKPAIQAQPQSGFPSQKYPSFRDAMAIKSSAARTERFTKDRADVAQMQSGLGSWLGFMLTEKPELVSATSKTTRPNVNTSGLGSSMRTKLSNFTKQGQSSAGNMQRPYYEQYLDSASQVASNQSANSPSTQGPLQDNPMKGRSPSQNQPKGKDFLHSAGVLGGKATLGAKGLFARGKNKFNRATSDKDPPIPTEPDKRKNRLSLQWSSFSTSRNADDAVTVKDESTPQMLPTVSTAETGHVASMNQPPPSNTQTHVTPEPNSGNIPSVVVAEAQLPSATGNPDEAAVPVDPIQDRDDVSAISSETEHYTYRANQDKGKARAVDREPQDHPYEQESVYRQEETPLQVDDSTVAYLSQIWQNEPDMRVGASTGLQTSRYTEPVTPGSEDMTTSRSFDKGSSKANSEVGLFGARGTMLWEDTPMEKLHERLLTKTKTQSSSGDSKAVREHINHSQVSSWDSKASKTAIEPSQPPVLPEILEDVDGLFGPDILPSLQWTLHEESEDAIVPEPSAQAEKLSAPVVTEEPEEMETSIVDKNLEGNDPRPTEASYLSVARGTSLKTTSSVQDTTSRNSYSVSPVENLPTESASAEHVPDTSALADEGVAASDQQPRAISTNSSNRDQADAYDTPSLEKQQEIHASNSVMAQSVTKQPDFGVRKPLPQDPLVQEALNPTHSNNKSPLTELPTTSPQGSQGPPKRSELPPDIFSARAGPVPDYYVPYDEDVAEESGRKKDPSIPIEPLGRGEIASIPKKQAGMWHPEMAEDQGQRFQARGNATEFQISGLEPPPAPAAATTQRKSSPFRKAFKRGSKDQDDNKPPPAWHNDNRRKSQLIGDPQHDTPAAESSTRNPDQRPEDTKRFSLHSARSTFIDAYRNSRNNDNFTRKSTDGLRVATTSDGSAAKKKDRKRFSVIGGLFSRDERDVSKQENISGQTWASRAKSATFGVRTPTESRSGTNDSRAVSTFTSARPSFQYPQPPSKPYASENSRPPSSPSRSQMTRLEYQDYLSRLNSEGANNTAPPTASSPQRLSQREIETLSQPGQPTTRFGQGAAPSRSNDPRRSSGVLSTDSGSSVHPAFRSPSFDQVDAVYPDVSPYPPPRSPARQYQGANPHSPQKYGSPLVKTVSGDELPNPSGSAIDLNQRRRFSQHNAPQQQGASNDNGQSASYTHLPAPPPRSPFRPASLSSDAPPSPQLAQTSSRPSPRISTDQLSQRRVSAYGTEANPSATSPIKSAGSQTHRGQAQAGADEFSDQGNPWSAVSSEDAQGLSNTGGWRAKLGQMAKRR